MEAECLVGHPHSRLMSVLRYWNHEAGRLPLNSVAVCEDNMTIYLPSLSILVLSAREFRSDMLHNSPGFRYYVEAHPVPYEI